MKTNFAILSLVAVLGAGCSSPVSYGDPDDVETVNIDWGRTDKQVFAQSMIESLLDAPELAFLDNPGKGDDPRIIAYMGDIRNETHEHVDTHMISDSIRSALVQSGRFRFVADTQGQDEIGERVRFDQESGRVDPEMARYFGQQLGADVVLYGNLRSIDKKGKKSFGRKVEDVYFQLVLNCVNIQTGEIIWSNEEELTKDQTIGLFG
jgi:uncharacterized protein (TIGR02722 family)